jgi:hypothetical protein
VPRFIIPPGLESGLSLPANHDFYSLKEAFAKKAGLANEVLLAMQAVLERLNPSERGTRFLSGGAYEWIMAVACWSAGIKTIPGGHSQDGFDLVKYFDSLKGLWSIKSFTGPKLTGSPRIVNKLGSTTSKPVLTHPTIFISPDLPGITLLDPGVAPKYASQARDVGDALVFPAALIKEFAAKNPEFVIPFSAPVNPKKGTQSPQMDIVVSILTAGTYPNLGPIMTRMGQIAPTIAILKKNMDDGIITQEQFNKILEKFNN